MKWAQRVISGKHLDLLYGAYIDRELYVMCGKKLINIWLAFRILGLEMNFDNFISVTCILCWNIGNCKIAFRYKNG